MIDKKFIETASNVNLADYLISRGENLKKAGQGYILAQHDSLRFYKNTFHWYSQCLQGNSIAFLCLYYKMTFPYAVTELCRFAGVTVDNHQDCRRVLGYLCNKRGLDYRLSIALIKNKLLYQDERGNCNFVIRDWQNNSIGCEIVGTGDKPYKRITAHAGYGFYIVRGKPTDFLFFESAIDLLSCYQLYPSCFTHHALVSMGGLNPSVVESVLSFRSKPKIWLCVDNDKAGDNFIKRFENARVFRPDNVKDWNDSLLKSQKQTK